MGRMNIPRIANQTIIRKSQRRGSKWIKRLLLLLLQLLLLLLVELILLLMV